MKRTANAITFIVSFTAYPSNTLDHFTQLSPIPRETTLR